MDAISQNNALLNGNPVTVLVEEIDPMVTDDEHLSNGHNGDIDWEMMHRALVPRLFPTNSFSATQAISPWLLDSRSPVSTTSVSDAPSLTPPPFAPPTGTQIGDMVYFHPDYEMGQPGEMEAIEHAERERTPSPASPRTISEHYNNVRAFVTDPAIGEQRILTPRQGARESRRIDLLTRPLNESSLGRRILDLRRYQWYRLPNGLVVMRFNRTESRWRANDISNYINWLRCGAYCHRSATHNIIAVANLPALNALLARDGQTPIISVNYGPQWNYENPRPIPNFMRDTFISRHLERAP